LYNNAIEVHNLKSAYGFMFYDPFYYFDGRFDRIVLQKLSTFDLWYSIYYIMFSSQKIRCD